MVCDIKNVRTQETLSSQPPYTPELELLASPLTRRVLI